MRRPLSVALCTATALFLGAFTCAAQVNVTSLASNGWYSDDTRADGDGTQVAGTNLKSPVLTDAPESLSGSSLHNADIFHQISFGTAPGTVPSGTWPSAMHLLLGANGAGKSTISHRKDDVSGHFAGSAIAPGFTAEYSWMGNGTASVTAGLKLGFKTSEFAGIPSPSLRTGENAWDKLLIYEPGNLNGTTSDSAWHVQSTSFTTGTWWIVDRRYGGNTIGTPMTLSAMTSSGVAINGFTTVAQAMALINAPGAVCTSVQFGIGSGNSNGSVFVNQLALSPYLGGQLVTFGGLPLECDQNVTSNFINGSGTGNGGFTTARVNGIELGLRGKLRFNSLNLPEDTFNSNGDGTYTFQAGHPTGGAGYVTPNTPRWNVDWSINTNYDGSSSLNVDDLTYEIRMDFDDTPGMQTLAFDPIGPNSMLAYSTPATVPFWDHSFGTNATPIGGGAEAVSFVDYNNLRAGNNLVQNSWNMEFFNEAPFAGFDPDVPGRYDFSLVAFQGSLEVARTQITIFVEAVTTYDQNVTNAAIYGGGNANGSFTLGRADGVEIGLRAKLRYPSSNVFNSNGDGTYTYNTGSGTGPAIESEWSLEWSVNSNHDGSTSRKVGNLTYRIGMDNDPGNGTDYLVFDPISAGTIIPYDVPEGPITFWDHSFGDNSTAMGAGLEAGSAPTYATYLSTYNLVQESWRPTFYQNDLPYAWNPNAPGRYEYYLAAYDGANEVARSAITIFVTSGSSLTLEADACQQDQDCDMPGAQIKVELHARNLSGPATGYQAFLAFDATKLTYVGASSTYSASPFPFHIQSIGSANTSPGKIRLDGNSFSSTSADSLLATLVFTATSECTTAGLNFDLTSLFLSELSNVGVPVVTALMDAPSIVADATPPVMGPVSDITAAADASLAGGCTGRVVTFASPSATDNCGSATVECFPPSGSTFPVGTTTVTCLATDACGNTSLETFDVTITSTNVVTVSLQLVGVVQATTRCIHFQTDTCAETDLTLDFDSSGLFVGDIEIPCGTYTSLCAKDEQHTEWATVGISISGTQYVAAGTLNLLGGDTDNDGDVDINDVTWFISQFGTGTVSGGCPWDGTTRDADFSNNTNVGSEDYVFLVANWLTMTDCSCTVPSTYIPRVPSQSQPYVRVHDAASRAADLNGDGWFDHVDVRTFESRHGLSHEFSEMLRSTTPATR